MRTFILFIEIVDEQFSDDEDQPTERVETRDEREVEAIDEMQAIEQLREELCFHNMYKSRDFTTLEIHEVV